MNTKKSMLYLPADILGKFQELIYAQCMLWFSPSRMINLEMRLQERIEIRNLASYEVYFQLLQDDPEEFATLIEGLTTKQTYFFRMSGQFETLEKEVLPRIEDQLPPIHELMARKTDSGSWKAPIRIWSAGCATGEEPYSIAMTVMNGLKYFRAWEIDILATDISKEALTTASLGVYTTKDLEKIPAFYQEKYMKAVNGGAVIEASLAEKISFRRFNLQNLDTKNVGTYTFMELGGRKEVICLIDRFDVIFYRNVMIYFDFPAQQRLLYNLFACLKPGGYLFTGEAESLHIYEHDFETLQYEGTYFYRKPEAGSITGRMKQNE